jgi:hypothetical protein
MSLGDALARCGNTDRARAEGKIVARKGYSAMKLQAMIYVYTSSISLKSRLIQPLASLESYV